MHKFENKVGISTVGFQLVSKPVLGQQKMLYLLNYRRRSYCLKRISKESSGRNGVCLPGQACKKMTGWWITTQIFALRWWTAPQRRLRSTPLHHIDVLSCSTKVGTSWGFCWVHRISLSWVSGYKKKPKTYDNLREKLQLKLETNLSPVRSS